MTELFCLLPDTLSTSTSTFTAGTSLATSTCLRGNDVRPTFLRDLIYVLIVVSHVTVGGVSEDLWEGLVKLTRGKDGGLEVYTITEETLNK